MNKQEPKNKLWALKQIDKEIEVAQLLKSAEYNEGYEDGCQFSQRVIDMMDEPKKPVVPECFDIDYKKYEYLKNNKSEILMTAIGGIHRVSFPGSFKDLPPHAYRTGIKWNKWTRETILWASRNYADFCQAVISGDYDVEKEPLYCVKIGKGYFSGFDETKVTYVLDDAPGSLARRVTYKDKNEAEMDAIQIGGIVEEVAEG